LNSVFGYLRAYWRDTASPGGREMKTMSPKIKEHTCPACKGTGFPAVKQPTVATRRIYPVKCVACTGKGKITDAS
jgi:DnaJ-class molecular chaperone